MPIESAADLAAFFNPDEHAIAAQYVPHGAADPRAVALLEDVPDDVTEIAGHAVKSSTMRLQAMIGTHDNAIPNLQDGETFVLAGDDVERVAQDVRRNKSGQLWIFELVEK